MNFIRKIIKRILCKHKDSDLEFIRNIHGDEILVVSTYSKIYRSMFKCKCGKIVYKQCLVPDKSENK